MSEYVLEVREIVKQFPGVKALDGVDMKLKKGEVHALVGENGAGKSTLMLTLGGVHRPDHGEIYLEGQKIAPASPAEAQALGISIVYQELSLVPELSIAENIFANRQPVSRAGMINRKKLYADTTEMLKLFHMEQLDPAKPVKELNIATQQVVEILKAISFHPKVLILDEPTSSLTEIEVEQLFENIRLLKNRGISFIYISHHLHEIFEIADRCTVLRDGKYICDADVNSIDEDYLVTQMVGRKIENIYGKRDPDAKIGDVLFEAKEISRKGAFENVSFTVRSGEIVGMSGLVGAGRTEIGRAIFGAEPVQNGHIFLDGEELVIHTAQQAIQNGIAYMSEDRKLQGLYTNFSVRANMIANCLKQYTHRFFLNENKISENAEKNVREFSISTPSIRQLVGNLSGGNQQKVLLSMWFGIHPKLLIVDEPTRGVDVGAKSEIYALLRQLARQGVGVLMISSDLPEVLGVSDRVLVVKEGLIVGNIAKENATEETIISLATGVMKGAAV